jgi:uncharacterized damage-inducible protein DinB
MMTRKETIVFTVEGVRKFHDWTHASINVVLDHLSTLSANDYVKELPGFGFPTLSEQVIHIFNCEGLWIHSLQRLRYVNRKPEEFRTHQHFSRIFRRHIGIPPSAYRLQL